MQHLSGLDALFLYAESESMHLHVALTAILDPAGAPGPLTVDRLRALVAARLDRVPPFTRRLVESPLGIDHPSWAEAGAVDLERHVRGVTVPPPGGPEDLGRVCGAIASLPLDRRLPLWELWLVDGLHDGNVALVAKIHHACIDGVSGAELITAFFDLEPRPVGAAAAHPPPREAPEGGVVPPGGTGHEDRLVEPPVLAAAVRSRAEALRRLAPLVRRTAGAVGEIRRRRSDGGEAGGTPLTAPRLSFNRRLTPERNCAFAHVPMGEVQAVRDRTRTTVNDVVLAVCAGALRRHLQRRGELPDQPLVAACPVSTRRDDGQDGTTGAPPPDRPSTNNTSTANRPSSNNTSTANRPSSNNKVSLLLTRLHTELADPLERLHATRRSTLAAKAEHALLGSSLLGDWSDAADPTVLRWAARLYLRSGLADHHPPLHNVTVSNVPGPSIPVYLAGARLVRAYPMGPVVEGAGLNITVMSYLDSIDVGFMVCDDLVPDVWDLADDVAPAFAELRDAVGATPASTPG